MPVRRRRRNRGFTLIELMIVLAVTLIGFLALLNLQKGVIQGNMNSWNALGATHLAEHVLETIRLEALEWYTDNGAGAGGYGQPGFRYLNRLPLPAAGATSGWQAAQYYPPGTPFQMLNQIPFDPVRDGGALTEIPRDRQQRYCVRFRMTWLVPNYLARAEVRVLWGRPDRPTAQYEDCRFADGSIDNMDAHPEDAFSVTMPLTVMKNVFVQQ